MISEFPPLSQNGYPPTQKKFNTQHSTLNTQHSTLPPSNRWFKPLNCAIATLALSASLSLHAQALPPPEDTPEEILRTEIILEARSPLDGRPLSAAEYDQLRETLAVPTPGSLTPEIQDLIFVLQLRRVIKPIFPLIP